MSAESFVARVRSGYIETLLRGDRPEARRMVRDLLAAGASARELLSDLVWPVMCQIRERYHENQISSLELSLATRLNRAITDQLCAQLPMPPVDGKKVLVVCGNAEPEELGGQICADLFESEGHFVRFVGGGVPDDEVLELLGKMRPELLVLFATLPSQLPSARKLIEYLHEINVCPQMQILCCGGVYERASGLAEEIGADLYAPDAEEALAVASEGVGQRATLEQQTVGRGRRMKRAAQRRAMMAAKAALRTVHRKAA